MGSMAGCALPGIFRPIRLPDGHLHVDGGILDGVPITAALQMAAPEDRILVLDCGLAPVTGRVDVCAAASDVLAGQACGVSVEPGRPAYGRRRREHGSPIGPDPRLPARKTAGGRPRGVVSVDDRPSPDRCRRKVGRWGHPGRST